MATSSALEGETLDLLDDFDSYMEDINDRLTVSRMVSDSVIKGVVTAVSKQASEVVAAKEIEIARLKEALRLYHLGFGASILPTNQDEQNLQVHGMCMCFANSSMETDSMTTCLCFLSQAAKEQLERLEKYFVHTGGHNYSQLSSSPDINAAYYSFKATVEAIYQQVHEIPSTDWQQDLKICEEVEAMVFSVIIHSMKEDYESHLWDVNSVLNLVDRFKEISSLRLELDPIQKYLVAPEHGHFSSHGSQEFDLFHRKMLSGHGMPSGSLWDEHVKSEESKISMPESLETSKLIHMTKEELYQYFRTEITKMKRDHESTVQQMTEEYFTLKREFLKEKELLKERVPFAALKKDKDFEMWRKKISGVILKLDDILMASEKLSDYCNYSRDFLDNLLSENYRLKGMLNDKKLELCNLSLQASDATRMLSQHSSTEDNMHKSLEHMRSCLYDAHIEVSVSKEVYKCILSELARQINSNCEDLVMKSAIMQDIIEIIYEVAVHDAEVAIQSECGKFSDLEACLSQQICGFVFQEVLRNMFEKLIELKRNCLEKDERLVLLEAGALKIEKELQLEFEENSKLKDKVLMLESSIEDRDKLLDEVSAALEEKKQQVEVADGECNNLRAKYESLVSDINELVLLKDQLALSEKQVDLYKIELDKLNEKLQVFESTSKKAGEEHAKFILELEQKFEAKDRENKKQMESIVQMLSKSFTNFELETKESIRKLVVRLENLSFQLNSLTSKVNVLRRTGLLYKERLEKRSSDLQKAEAEVDLLGDEVDALLSLLEKVYVGLDHYSPILQHYPGIMEILKLIRRELSEEAVKLVGSAA